ncbi:helix-turn-helix domain-containing protein [Niabella hirudinis]|uniref:helix-turn-helix domain-containing protein n=1 Tax=Niabella hirudinis TaxID=1285929 RepID=UPI003EBE2CED
MLLLMPAIGAKAQDSVAFDKIYNKISTKLSQENLSAALFAADSLLKTSHTARFRIRSMMLIAKIYQQKEDIDSAIEYAQKLEKLAGETGDYAWQARGNGYLGGLYRIIGLYDKAQNYTDKALKIIPRISDPEQANSTRGLMLQELAFSNMDGEHNRLAIKYLEDAGKSLGKLQNNRDFIVMNNERLLGDNYRMLKSYDTALACYQKALALSTPTPNHYVVGMICKGMAEIFIEEEDLKTAKIYLDKAEKIASASQYLQLKEGVYAVSKKYYERARDQEHLAIAREKKDSVTGALLDKRTELLDKTYNQLEQRGIRAELTSNIKTIVILCVVLLLVLGAVFFVVYRRKKHRQLAQFERILEQLHAKEKEQKLVKEDILPVAEPDIEINQDETVVSGEDLKHDTGAREKRLMTGETELKLLKGLENFERSDHFLNGELSLSSLATRLNTNTKYLSYLIKTHKKADFNSYINELRVNHIVEKLKNQPGWRQYKISALATTAGFSSHSQFAAVFKTFTGLSPSVFIKYLEKKHE